MVEDTQLLERRAAEERERARLATSAAIRAAHLGLARAYEDRIRRRDRAGDD